MIVSDLYHSSRKRYTTESSFEGMIKGQQIFHYAFYFHLIFTTMGDRNVDFLPQALKPFELLHLDFNVK